MTLTIWIRLIQDHNVMLWGQIRLILVIICVSEVGSSWFGFPCCINPIKLNWKLLKNAKMKVARGRKIVLLFLGSMDDSPYLCAVEGAETWRKLARGFFVIRKTLEHLATSVDDGVLASSHLLCWTLIVFNYAETKTRGSLNGLSTKESPY